MVKKLSFKVYSFLLHHKRNYSIKIGKLFQELLKSQYFDRDKMEIQQLETLNILIDSAKKNTVYYKKVIDGTIKYDENFELFSRNFPVLTKQMILDQKEALLNLQETPRFVHSTSGSTGVSMRIETSGKAEVYRQANMMRSLSWWGAKVNDPNVLIWGLKKEIKHPYRESFKNWMRNQLKINVFDLDETTIERYFNLIQKHEPVYIRGYKSGILQLAELIEMKNLRFKINSLKVVIVTSEVLFEIERTFIEKILGTKVCNEYGSAETGIIAMECPEGSLHINQESVYISTDEDNSAYVTELHNNGMPLINFKNDDRLVVSDRFCGCGRKLQIIERIEGRISDYVLSPDGSKKNHIMFLYFIRELEDQGLGKSIKQFRVSQKKMDFFVEIVPDAKNFNKLALDFFKKRMYDEIGDKINVHFQLVDTIEREKSGKLRFFVRKD